MRSPGAVGTPSNLRATSPRVATQSSVYLQSRLTTRKYDMGHEIIDSPRYASSHVAVCARAESLYVSDSVRHLSDKYE